MSEMLTVEEIRIRIHQLPNRSPFLLSQDLAYIYETEVKRINEAVKRNPKRFPEDFVFQLSKEEVEILRSQNVVLHSPRANPYGFYREGANMLSTVLNSEIAVKQSVQMMRAFSSLEERIMPLAEDFSSLKAVNELKKYFEEIRLALYQTQELSKQLTNLPQEFQKLNQRLDVLEKQKESQKKTKKEVKDKYLFFGKYVEIFNDGIEQNREEVNQVHCEMRELKEKELREIKEKLKELEKQMTQQKERELASAERILKENSGLPVSSGEAVKAREAVETVEAREAVEANDKTKVLTKAQGEKLKEKVQKLASSPKEVIQIWHAFKKHFDVTRYIHLPQAQFEEALTWIEELDKNKTSNSVSIFLS